MFFMIGVTPGRKDLPLDQLVICGRCGRYGRYRVFMTFTQLLLFFIPCLKWGKRYYVEMSCCGALYELDPEAGEQIARGSRTEIRQGDLTLVRDGNGSGSRQAGTGAKRMRACPACGYETEEDFTFCPKCGERLG